MTFVTAYYTVSGNPIPEKSDHLYYVQIDAGAVQNLSGEDFAGIADTTARTKKHATDRRGLGMPRLDGIASDPTTAADTER